MRFWLRCSLWITPAVAAGLGTWVACNNQDPGAVGPSGSMSREAGSPTMPRDEQEPELSLTGFEDLLVVGEELGASLADEIPAVTFAAFTAEIVAMIQADPTLTPEEKLEMVQYANSFLRGALGDTDPDVRPDLRDAVRFEIRNSWSTKIREESEALRLELRKNASEPRSDEPELEVEGMQGSLGSLGWLLDLFKPSPAAIREYADEMAREFRAELDARERERQLLRGADPLDPE